MLRLHAKTLRLRRDLLPVLGNGFEWLEVGPADSRPWARRREHNGLTGEGQPTYS